MNKITRLIFISILIVFGTSCSNDIDLTSEWKDIPIVYGLVSPVDSVHYIRVEKAFLDQNTSALDIAQIPDSLYYDNASVQLQKMNSTDDPIIFQRVDAIEDGFNRENGIFATAPNYIYKAIMPQGERLEPNAFYEFQLNRGDNLPLVTANTIIIDDINITSPGSPDNAPPLNWGNYDYELAVKWRSKPTIGIFDVVLFFHIDEHDVNNPANPTPIILEWEAETGIPVNSFSNNGDISERVNVSGEDFFPFIGSRLEVKDGVFRRFKSVDLLLRVGGNELTEFINIGLANSGITSTQVVPTYTNMSEGLGLFSSRNEKLIEGYQVSTLTIDSLVDGQFTKDLNFEY